MAGFLLLVHLILMTVSYVNGNNRSDIYEGDLSDPYLKRKLIEVKGTRFDIGKAPAPLFKDPIFDGAADPTVIWDEKRRQWRIFYTQRRVKGSDKLPGVSFAYGTAIAMAVSSDFGATWKYQGTCKGLDFDPGLNTFWAPDVFQAPDGIWHMFTTYVRRVRVTWGGKQMLAHFTSSGDFSTWTHVGLVEAFDPDEAVFKQSSSMIGNNALFTQSSENVISKVIDADVRLLPDGRWKIWFKDLKAGGGGMTASAVSRDLKHWIRNEGVEVEDTPAHEAPMVFEWKGFYWLIVDPLIEQGLRVYRSKTAIPPWTTQPNLLLSGKGVRADDGNAGSHCDVVVVQDEDRAFIFYFTHPMSDKKHMPLPMQRRSSLQVAELGFDGKWLTCNRDAYASSSAAASFTNNDRSQSVGGGDGGRGGYLRKSSNSPLSPQLSKIIDENLVKNNENEGNPMIGGRTKNRNKFWSKTANTHTTKPSDTSSFGDGPSSTSSSEFPDSWWSIEAENPFKAASFQN